MLKRSVIRGAAPAVKKVCMGQHAYFRNFKAIIAFRATKGERGVFHVGLPGLDVYVNTSTLGVVT